MNDVIDLYYCATPNCQKITVMLEEVGLDYRLHYIDIHAGDQLDPVFLAINPNNKVPAIRDPDGPGGEPLVLWESAAIMLYLAEKTGQLIPTDHRRRHMMMQWLMFQMSGIGPMVGQMAHFILYAKGDASYGLERYGREVDRLFGVLDRHLASHPFLADEYSVADLAVLPVSVNMWERAPERADQFPHVKAWSDRIVNRPGVRRGLNIDLDRIRGESMGTVPVSEEVWSTLFGDRQHNNR